MVQINELRIYLDNSTLYLDASVLEDEYYNNVGIIGVQIDTQDTFKANINAPSTNVVYTKEYESSKENPNKHIKLCIKQDELDVSLKDNIFYVWVITSGDIIGEPPCGMDVPRKLGVCINWQYLYNLAKPYFKEVGDSCNIPKNFIDYILRYKTILLALKTGHYTVANKYWNKFFKDVQESVLTTNTCGCNGRV